LQVNSHAKAWLAGERSLTLPIADCHFIYCQLPIANCQLKENLGEHAQINRQLAIGNWQ